jgi:CelD/BcsL family acetyltransferase involved in cellulose biosynthesis
MAGVVTLRERGDLTGAAWDAHVRAHPAATIFHRACWHDVLDAVRPGGTLRFEVELDGQPVGYWCGFLMRRFGLKVFGSPLPGSATDYMYPLLSVPVAPGAILEGVERWARRRGVAHLEIGGECFPAADLAVRGYGPYQTRSYRVDLSGGEAAVWKALKPAMRNKVRKAEKLGVVVTEDTAPDFPARFFALLEDVFHRQNSVPTYDLRLITAVVKTLGAAGHLRTLTAWHEGRMLSSMILLVDEHSAYFWGGASYAGAYPFGANDLIHWDALKWCTAQGLRTYDTCGGGEYKEKFGGTLHYFPAGYLALNPLFGLVRSAVRHGVRARQRLLGGWHKLRPARLSAE